MRADQIVTDLVYHPIETAWMRAASHRGATVVDGLGMRRQSVAKHLAVLEAANLVSHQRQGREKLHYLNPVPIVEISRRWLDRYSGERVAAILNLRDALQESEHE